MHLLISGKPFFEQFHTDLVLRGLLGREGEGDGGGDEVADGEALKDPRDTVTVQKDPPTKGIEDDAQHEEFDGPLSCGRWSGVE